MRGARSIRRDFDSERPADLRDVRETQNIASRAVAGKDQEAVKRAGGSSAAGGIIDAGIREIPCGAERDQRRVEDLVANSLGSQVGNDGLSRTVRLPPYPGDDMASRPVRPRSVSAALPDTTIVVPTPPRGRPREAH